MVNKQVKQTFANTHLRLEKSKKKRKIIRMQERVDIKKEAFFDISDKTEN